MIDKETIFLLGAQDPEIREIERFMRAQEAECRNVYGNPYRGYAGAYIP